MTTIGKSFGYRAFLWVALLMPAVTNAGVLHDREFKAQSYPFSDRRHYYVFVPETDIRHQALPMVMVLHGCRQGRDTVIEEFGWVEVAEQHDFILVAPDISTDDLLRSPHCWGYWESREIHQGRGEVEDLYRIGLQVERQWRVDVNRRHIVGLSSGGFMANAAAVAHNEYWASAGVHSGGGYNEGASTYSRHCESPRAASGNFKSPTEIATAMRDEMDSPYIIPLMLLHSTNDCSVGYGLDAQPARWGGVTSNRDAWLSINGGAIFSTEDCSRNDIQCRHMKYGTAVRSTLEVISFDGLIDGTHANKGHYWSGGKTNGRWTLSRGPQAAALFWNFFHRHPRTDQVTYEKVTARPKGG